MEKILSETLEKIKEYSNEKLIEEHIKLTEKYIKCFNRGKLLDKRLKESEEYFLKKYDVEKYLIEKNRMDLSLFYLIKKINKEEVQILDMNHLNVLDQLTNNGTSSPREREIRMKYMKIIENKSKE